MTHEFSIGDIVKIRDYDSIPQDKKTKTAYGDPSLITPRKSSLCGKTVEIVDRLYSEQFDSYIYRVKEQDADRPSRSSFRPTTPQVSWRFSRRSPMWTR